MANEKYFHVLEALSSNSNFSAVTRITEAGEIKQKKLEFVMRFFAFSHYDFDPTYDVEEFIDKHVVDLAEDETAYKKISINFEKTFKLLHGAAGKDALRRYDHQQRKFVGSVGQVALEAVAVGVARNIKSILQKNNPERFVLDKIKSFWSEDEVKTFSASGVSGTKRLSQTLAYGQKYFAP